MNAMSALSRPAPSAVAAESPATGPSRPVAAPSRRARALGWLALGAALACGPAAASPESAARAVGQVSLLIGQAWVVRADGSQLPLQRGSAIAVGDRVETAANGHVHLRFVDNAAVSVRPDSVLQVQAYAYDPQRPQANEIRFRVDKGVARSISGAATEQDKSRFRLNTPIAAIGVRGTDFIVQTDPTGVRATVSDGTIVVAALGGDCAVNGLGPCAGTEVRELSAAMGRLMAEVRPGDHATRIVPAADQALASAAGSHDASSPGRSMTLAAARASGLSAAEPTAAEAQRGNDRRAAGLLTVAEVNVPDLNRPSNLGGQLVWGRWAIAAEPQDRLSVPFSLARLGRHVTVADHEMGLFRTDQAVAGELFVPSLAGPMEFRLTRASATYEAGGQTEAATISGSNLTIDFTRRTFATALDLSAVSGVKGELRIAGDIRQDGIFAVRDADQRLAGAISLDAKEVGYLFERNVGNGLFKGRTLWGP